MRLTATMMPSWAASATCEARVWTVQPVLLLWQEGACSEKVALRQRTSGRIARMERVAAAAGATIVVGCDRVSDDDPKTRFNSAVVVDSSRGVLGYYDKLVLVPFTEFHPPGRPRFGGPSADVFTHGKQYPTFSLTGGNPPRCWRFSVGICYDTAFARVFRHYMKEDAAPDFFVVPAFEAHDRAMRLQASLLALAKFRAIETRRAMVRNAFGGYSGVIDGNGMLVVCPGRSSSPSR